MIQMFATHMQDQEIAAGATWLDDCSKTSEGRMSVVYLFDVINEQKMDVIRGIHPPQGLDDDELTVLCAMASIGLAEVIKAYQNKNQTTP